MGFPIRIRTRTLLTAVAALAASAVGPTPGLAQDAPMPLPLQEMVQDDSTLVDRVVAVVGDSVITMTEVLAEYRLVQARGQTVDPTEILDELVNVQLVLQAASRDTTLQILDEELDDRVEAAVAEVRQRFPSDQAFQQALQGQGLTPQQYRTQLRDRIRTEQLREMFIRRELRGTPSVPVSEEEMRAFFEERRSALQQRPELLTLEQVFVEPTASDSAWAAAEAEADSLRALIVGGADFAELAREHSDDPASAAEGGEMGWFRRGVMVKEFEQAAFNLNDGQVSQPIRTRYGYHVIRVEKQRPGEVNARHILIRPAVSEGDQERAVTLAAEVARRARQGESMDSLRAEYGNQELPLEIRMARDELAQLPYPAADALGGAAEGDVIGPLDADLGGQSYRVVVRVDEIREAGDFTFEDVREQVRQQLSQSKRIERIYERLRNTMYVEIRM